MEFIRNVLFLCEIDSILIHFPMIHHVKKCQIEIPKWTSKIVFRTFSPSCLLLFQGDGIFMSKKSLGCAGSRYVSVR